jgi:hypothetical protein
MRSLRLVRCGSDTLVRQKIVAMPTLGTKVAGAVVVTTSKRNFIDVEVTPAQAWLSTPTPSPACHG